ncbi:MAG: cyclic nucleotide-binding domain-containing protein [Chromatiales bacterium]|jgi:CRP-like cAMP-binding protein
MYSSLSQLITQADFPEQQYWHRQTFKTNDVIIREGDTDKHIYLIEQGTLIVTCDVDLAEARQIRPGLSTLEPGQVFGEFCLFNDLPRSATVSASTDGQLVVIDAGKLQQYMDAHPETGYEVMKEIYKTVVDRLNKSNKRVENLLAWGLKVHGIDKHL